ncbi:hypothetical protein G9P44_004073 [Scheffersomyces stipitis]|nr:hypothetical protein G9P44_004073 [Scheffersomyces stipitis]
MSSSIEKNSEADTYEMQTLKISEDSQTLDEALQGQHNDDLETGGSPFEDTQESRKQKSGSRKIEYSVFLNFFFYLIVLGGLWFLIGQNSTLRCMANGNCEPLFTLRILDSPKGANQMLSGIREGLRMLSYVAIDLGVNNNLLNNKNLNYDHVIDTLSNSNNIFKFGYNGYCRYDSATKEQICSKCNGLDIFSCLVKDIGIQLGKVSNSNSPDLIGESLCTVYHESMSSMLLLYEFGKAKRPGYENIDLNKLAMVQQLDKLNGLGKVIIHFNFAQQVASSVLLATLAMTFVYYLITKEILMTRPIRYLHLLFVIIQSTLLLLLQIYFQVLASRFEELKSAVMDRGYGLYLYFVYISIAISTEFFVRWLENFATRH